MWKRPSLLYFAFAGLAQLIEQLICNQQVVSLSLTSSSICSISVMVTLHPSKVTLAVRICYAAPTASVPKVEYGAVKAP